GGPAEITVKQLIPYRTREISASLPLKRITEGLKINTEDSLNILLSFTVHNKTKKSYLSFPVYMAGRNTLRDISGITRFYMPKARILSELKSSFADYLKLYLPGTVKGGSFPAKRRAYTQPADSRLNGIVFSSLADAVLKIDKRRSGKGRPSAFPLPGITEPPVYLSAYNTTNLDTLIFLASIAGSFGYKPFLLFNSNRIILCIDTGIPIDRLDKTGKYSAVIKDISGFLLKEKMPSRMVLPLFSAYFKEKAAQGLNSPNKTEPEPAKEEPAGPEPAKEKPAEKNPEESPQHTYFQDLQNTVIRQLEQIAGMGIQSYKRLQLKENPVPAVYPGIYGENYLPGLVAASRSFSGQSLSKRGTSITGDFNKLLKNIGIRYKEK
ncbi:MAG: hypothetical protein GXP33_08400, partial [Spirochaetes bacterium]|nr:hypothetical protein [Spirochaetota bacterium]